MLLVLRNINLRKLVLGLEIINPSEEMVGDGSMIERGSYIS